MITEFSVTTDVQAAMTQITDHY